MARPTDCFQFIIDENCGVHKMRIEQVELPNNVLKVVLDGSLDIAGAGKIDLPFSVIAGSNKKVIVDLGKVGFLASIGIRILVKTARALTNKGGRLIVYNLSEQSIKVLRATGIDAIIPIAANEAAAIAESEK
ncbi:MAG: STAS domain-containing protein [Hyphomicrobiaceae bacterium]